MRSPGMWAILSGSTPWLRPKPWSASPNARMAGAIRLVSIERGHDPKVFAIMPFGGGGALHAGALIADVGLSCALVPRFPGITSALGCVIADLRHDQVRTVNWMLGTLDVGALDTLMASEGRAAEAIVAGAGVAVERIDVLYELDMHYLGQTHTISVPLPVTLQGASTGITSELILTAFEQAYRASFSRLLPGIPSASSRCAPPPWAGDRPRSLGARAGGGVEPGRRPARLPPRLVRRWLARHRRLVATGPPRRRGRRRAGHPRAARRDHGGRSWSRGARGRTGQRHHRETGMSSGPIPVQRTALLIVDLQNDFVHPQGAYARGGQTSAAIAALPARVAPLAGRLRDKGGWVVSTQFTLVPGKGGEPLISPHLKAMRPFLGKGDFAPGSWATRSWMNSNPQTSCREGRLFRVLHDADGVGAAQGRHREALRVRHRHQWRRASTVRDAHVRDLDVTVLHDGCAAFSRRCTTWSIAALRPVARVLSVAEALAEVEAA